MPSLRLTLVLPLFAGIIALSACAHSATSGKVRPDRTAPDSFQVVMETSRGPVSLMINRDWAPVGVDRFYTLVRDHYYDEARIYRVVPGFVAQFGLAADPKKTAHYEPLTIPDDSVRHSNLRGTISFARSSRATRTAQLFFNLADNVRLDRDSGFGFPPIGHVLQGMEAVDSFTSEYNRRTPPDLQDSIGLQGNAYLLRAFPKLDFIRSVKIQKEWN